MKILGLSFILVIFSALISSSQTPDPEHNYRVFDATGNPSSLAAIVRAMDGADAIFLGEQHDDSVGHTVEFEIFKQAVAKYSDRRKVALSMEMFERDVQIVVNEYLASQISEAQFLASSRPWGNYKTDYRPLLELAKDKKLTVIAANAPRRYVNMVSRGGRDTLNGLSKEAKSWLAPLPYGEPSDAYAKKFKDLMGPSPEAQMGIDKILASQSLWDATMANSVANYLKKNKRALVVHLNGGFHTESRLGTIQQLLKYRPKAKVLVVTIRYEDDFKTFDKAKHSAIGDFVILTDAKVPRSKK